MTNPEHGVRPLTAQFEEVWKTTDAYERRKDPRSVQLAEMTTLAAALLDHVGGEFIFDPAKLHGRNLTIEPMALPNGMVRYSLEEIPEVSTK